MHTNEIENRVAKSSLLQMDISDFFPTKEIVEYDISENLWQGIALKEKDFRQFIKTNDWLKYKNKHIALICSTEAIIPSWAYMLLSTSLQDIALSIHYGSKKNVEQELLLEAIGSIDSSDYENKRIIIKGCSDKEVGASAWVAITQKLKPVAKSIMFGEACSTVPVFKRPR